MENSTKVVYSKKVCFVEIYMKVLFVKFCTKRDLLVEEEIVHMSLEEPPLLNGSRRLGKMGNFFDMIEEGKGTM